MFVEEVKKRGYIYILRCVDETMYTGISTNVLRRYREHIKGTAVAAKYTKSHIPKKILMIWSVESLKEAAKIEYRIKMLTRKKKEELIKNPATEIENIRIKAGVIQICAEEKMVNMINLQVAEG